MDADKWLDGNKLIAKFMGMKWDIDSYDGSKGLFVFDSSMENILDEINYYDFAQLMPVVEKINEYYECVRPFVYGNPENVNLEISATRVQIKGDFWTNSNILTGDYWNYLRKSYSLSKYSLREALFLICVDFVKWYFEVKNINL